MVEYDILVDGTVNATSQSCDGIVTLIVPRRCDPYEIVLKGYYVQADGQRGLACARETSAIAVMVNMPPSTPGNFNFNVLGQGELTTYWSPPLDDGGCPDYNLTAVLQNASGVLEVHTVSGLAQQTSFASILMPSSIYTILLSAVSTAGASDPANVTFPGTLQQTCTMYVKGAAPEDHSLVFSTSRGSSCSYSVACTGINLAYVPQVTVSCDIQSVGATLLWWAVAVGSPSTPVYAAFKVGNDFLYHGTSTANV
jgi:hypothetical protein